MRAFSLVGIGLILLGAFLIAWAIATHQVTLYLLVILPVLTSSSPLFVAGILSIFFGVLAAIVGTGFESGPEPTPSVSPRAHPSGSGVGGVILIGPVPIVFGSWSGLSRRARIGLAIGGAVVFVAILTILLLAYR
jgi:uncharacterized membrane protein